MCYSVSEEDVAEILRNMDDENNEQFSNEVKQSEWSEDIVEWKIYSVQRKMNSLLSAVTLQGLSNTFVMIK